MLKILGGGGWFPGHARHTACALLRNGDSAIIIDAGTGIARFIEEPGLLRGTSRVDILLTHFHLDHIAGLAYLPALGLCEQTTIWGPGEALYGTSCKDLLAQVSRQPFHPVPLEQQDIDVRDLPLGEIELGAARLASRRQDRHSAPSMGFRFGDVLAWITDTAYDPASVSFAAGVRVLAHEAWFTEAAPRNPEIHSSAAQAAEVAEAAGVEQLALIHLPPFERSLEPLVAEAQATVPRAVAATDGTSFGEIRV